MVQVNRTLRAETELLWDAADALQRMHVALTHRHGAAFRRLERDIEAIWDATAPGEIGDQLLDGSTFVLTPPRPWLDLIERGKQLGVI